MEYVTFSLAANCTTMQVTFLSSTTHVPTVGAGRGVGAGVGAGVGVGLGGTGVGVGLGGTVVGASVLVVEGVVGVSSVVLVSGFMVGAAVGGEVEGIEVSGIGVVAAVVIFGTVIVTGFSLDTPPWPVKPDFILI